MRSFFTMSCLLILVNVFSQNNYYPGGLGNNNLTLWLNANNAPSVIYNGSNQVSQWSDLSGNGYHFLQATAGNKPVYGAATGPGGRPALSFASASSQYLALASIPSSVSFTGGVSSLSVVNFSTTGSFERIFDFGNGNASDNIITGRQASSANFYAEGWNGASGGQTYTSTNPIVNGANNIFATVQQGGTAGTQTAVAFYSAGALQASTGSSGSSVTYLPQAINRASNFVGRSNWVADTYFNGTLSEILFFNTALNATRRTILQQYLSAAWGLAITPSYFTPPSPTTYNRNLVGIGYTSGADNVLSNPIGSANGATDGLGFSSGSTAADFLNVPGFIMGAHNAQANTVRSNVTLSGITPSGINLLNRSWFIHSSGGNSSGNITLNFNFSDYNGSGLPAGAVSYGLLYNASNGNYGSGSNSIITKNFTAAGSNVAFVVPASSLADGYYTLVWSTTFILPVLISNFTAEEAAGTVKLKWQTNKEINTDYFIVERSAGTNDFVAAGTVKASGNSDVNVAYQFSDSKPADGWNSYRLKMVDLDGSINFSAIRKIQVNSRAAISAITFYPNPVNDMLGIDGGQYNGKANIQIFNSAGQSVWEKEKRINGYIAIPVDFLAKGVFFIKISAGIQTVVKQFIRN